MNRTKAFLINAFWQLLEKKPYNKITVKDIVDTCQVNRNTFYYHFQDIPSLLDIAVASWAESILKKQFQYDSPLDCLLPLIQSCIEHKIAILHIYRSVHQEDFLQHLNRMCQHIVDEYMRLATTKTSLSPNDQKMLVWFSKCTLVGIFLDWFNDGMEYDLMERARQLTDLFTSRKNEPPHSHPNNE